MTTPALATVASPRVPEAAGMLSCLGGFSPRLPASETSSPSYVPHWSRVSIDADLAHMDYAPELAAKIMRKRQQERERNSNRLTPRMQRIGLDIAALNSQVDEKKASARAMSGYDDRILAGMELKGKIVAKAEAHLNQSIREAQKECVTYSLQNLAKHQRREWHLSDPDQLKKDIPARMEGTKPAISSMQMFEGEQGVSPEVMREKRQTQVEWLMAQMKEKKLREEAEKEADAYDDAALLKANDLRVLSEAAETQERNDAVMENTRANVEMASARSARRQLARERDQAATKEHMKNQAEYNLMREKYDYSIGTNGKRRDYKRCSYEEEKQAWDTNLALVQARIGRGHDEDEERAAYHQIGMTVDDLGFEYQSAWDRMNVRRRREFDEANKAMAQERKERNAKERQEYASYAPSSHDAY